MSDLHLLPDSPDQPDEAPAQLVDAAGNTYTLTTRADDPVSVHVFVANSVREGLRALSAATEIHMKDLAEQAFREFLDRQATR